ncbi:hypothetical protein ACJJTC_013615 [Scirpophaga incertulas]
MNSWIRVCILILSLQFMAKSAKDGFLNLNSKYYLVSEAYNVAKNLFDQGRACYDRVKIRSLNTIDTFLDLVQVMHDEMGRELRSAIIKFYKVKSFRDFTNYIVSLDELTDIVEHCLIDPVEKMVEIREQFHGVIKNFEDVRHFETVNTCHKELPDEVAVAHCILHQAVIFNETMQESLLTIVEIKTRQHAQEINSSLHSVQSCLRNFVPRLFQLLMLDAFTDTCSYLRIVNASIQDLVRDKWRAHDNLFCEKWSPLISLLKIKSTNSQQVVKDPLLLSLFASNLTSVDIFKTLY